MTNKRSWLGMLVIILVFGVMVVGCTSTFPYIYSDNSSKNYTILGEVTYKASSGGRQGLIDFLAEAKKQYPGTDYVIDVMVDSRVTKFFFFGSSGFVYRGTAIKYN